MSMNLKEAFPKLWNYVAATIDENSAPGPLWLDELECEDVALAVLAEAELTASGKSDREIWSYAYEGAVLPLLSACAEEYCGKYVF
jgi:hypothetical protein